MTNLPVKEDLHWEHIVVLGSGTLCCINDKLYGELQTCILTNLLESFIMFSLQRVKTDSLSIVLLKTKTSDFLH